MATKLSGIAGLNTNTNTRTYLDTLASLRTTEAQRAIQPSPDMNVVRQRQAEYANYLGQTDYAKQLEESQNMGKLQLALALAQRGFAAAGATPQRGESSVSTLSRELLSPLAGDAGTVAGRMMQQKQAINAAKTAEERQLKLAALQKVEAENIRTGNLALKIMPKPKTSDMKQGNRGFARRRGADGKPTGPVVPLQYTFDGGRYQARTVGEGTQTPVTLGGKNPTHTVTNEKGEALGAAGAGEKAPFESVKYIVRRTSGADGEPDTFRFSGSGGAAVQVRQERGESGQLGSPLNLVSGKPVALQPGDELVTFANLPDNLKGTVAKTGTTDATVEANRNLLFTSMNRLQNQQLQGPNTPYSAKSALYFDVGAYQRGDFAFRYIPPGTNPLEAAAKSVPITNERLQKYITRKVNSLADTTLKTDFGSANQEIKEARLSKAIRSILNETPQMLFGAQNIPTLGVTGDGENVGYTPTTAAFDPALQTEKLKTAVRTLKEDPSANPTITYGPVAFPSSQEFLNKTTGRIKVATELFPDAFSDQQVAGTEAFDPDMVQQRRDIEAALPRATLTIGASNDDYRKVISDGAAKISVARDKLQNSTDARSAKESFLLFRQFREGLLDFKNAARESKVEGFFTGRVASGLSRLGLAKFISEEGAEHWARLTAASDRFQEGISRRVGKDFGDDRISNLDAAAYQKLVADIKKGKDFNRILVDDGLSRIKNNMTDLMSRGGRVGWTERDLRQASEAGVDFSELRTMENWHGHGYYGKDRYSATRQQTPSLSQNQRDVIRTQGQLKDTMYGGQYTVPNVNYLTDTLPTFQRAREETSEGPAIPATGVLRKGPVEFQKYIESLALASRRTNTPVPVDVMRRRVVQGIISYNTFREQIR